MAEKIVNVKGYVCLSCNSEHGQPSFGEQESWYWRRDAIGQIGPFCSPDCSKQAAPVIARFSFLKHLLETERIRLHVDAGETLPSWWPTGPDEKGKWMPTVARMCPSCARTTSYPRIQRWVVCAFDDCKKRFLAYTEDL